MPYSYWRDWASRDGVAMAKRFARPDARAARNARLPGDRRGLRDLARRRSTRSAYVELVTISGVNHLFIAGHGAPSPLEYKVDNHVDARVMAKLSAFVLQRRD